MMRMQKTRRRRLQLMTQKLRKQRTPMCRLNCAVQMKYDTTFLQDTSSQAEESSIRVKAHEVTNLNAYKGFFRGYAADQFMSDQLHF